MTADAAPAPQGPGPADHSDPLTRQEWQRASIWLGLAAALFVAWMVSDTILIIIGGCVIAAMLDGGTRLLGRVLPIGRGWRLLIVCIAVLAFLVWTVLFAGASIAGQFDMLRATITQQASRAMTWGQSAGLVTGGDQVSQIAQQLMGSIGKVTSAVGTAFGALSSLAMIVVLGLFLAVEPDLYERGVAWLLPTAKRAAFYRTSTKMGHTLRMLMAGRLLGMTVEGVGTWLLLWAGGVPMAGLLGILTGLLAFLPNIGAIVSGVLIVLVGFSQGAHTGFWALGVYCVVQVLDGYVIVPMVAKRSVDLAPALVLAMQLLLGALFGILGLALADPIAAMVKVMLEERATGAKESVLSATAAPT